MNHLLVRPTYGSAAAHYDMGVCQSHAAFYTADGGPGRTVVAAAAAAEAAATAAAAAVAAANASQQAAYAAYAANAVTGNANAVTSVDHNCGRQGRQPFPARRRKLWPNDSWLKMQHQEGWRSVTWDCKWARSHKPRRWKLTSDDSWCKMPHQEGWRTFAWDCNRARSHKRHSYGHGAKRGSPSLGCSRLSKQRLLDKRNREAAAEVLKLLLGMSTQTLSDGAKGSQTELFHDEAVLQPQQVQFQ